MNASKEDVEFQALWEKATALANVAGNAQLDFLKGKPFCFDCGFAWVTVKPARGPFISWCKKNGKGDKAYGGGWQFWYSECYNGGHAQNVSAHEAACAAFAGVLTQAGISCSVGSRLD